QSIKQCGHILVERNMYHRRRPRRERNVRFCVEGHPKFYGVCRLFDPDPTPVVRHRHGAGSDRPLHLPDAPIKGLNNRLASMWHTAVKEDMSVDSTPSPDKKSTRFGVIYVVLFLAIFGALDYGYYLIRGTVVEHMLIDTLTVRPAAALINAVVPAVSARASGHSLLTPFGQINIFEGCEGSDGMFLLIAAVLPFPARRLSKLVGVIGGVSLMYAMNQLRIVAI